MNSRKSILRYGIILYVCVFLTGAPFVVSSFAKITMKEPVEGKVITIEKGDTLWDLAGEYLEAPYKWPEFKKYNTFTNPDLIYPGEELQLPVEVAKDMLKEFEKKIVGIETEVKAIHGSNQEISSQLQSQMAELRALKEAVEELRSKIDQIEQKVGEVGNLERQFSSLDKRLSESESEVKSELKESTKRVNQLDEKVDKIDTNVKTIDEKVDKLASDGQREITKINQGIENLSTKVSQNQESISRLEETIADTGEVEEMSQGKKAFVVLTALAGGIAWFVVSSLSHSD